MNPLELRREIESHGILKAVKKIEPSCESEAQADAYLYAYGKNLILKSKAALAGIVWWGDVQFNPRPRMVQRVWNGISTHKKLLIQGAASMSKSYTGIAWNLLRYHGDPEGTTIKLISTTGGHARSNTFGTIRMLQTSACCKLPGFLTSESLAATEGDQRGCISIVRIKEGADNSGVMQGFHPLPRAKPHPVYGPSTAVFGVFDEAEEIPLGLWTGVDNMLASAGEGTQIKVMGFYNPKDQSSRVAALAEPIGGWGEFDIETGVKGKDEWESREGWHIIRLDAAKSENVQQRKIVHMGMQTYEAFDRMRSSHGGNSPIYHTMGRGAYPLESAVSVIINQSTLNAMRIEFVFVGGTTKMATLDVAVDGRDEAILTIGRCGLANGYKTREGVYQGFKEPRKVAQADQQISIVKGETKIVGDNTRKACESFGVQPEWLMLDRTGNGAQVHDYLRAVWSPEVQGIDFSSAAQMKKILEEDKQTAFEEFDGIHSEVWFATARLAEFRYIGISVSLRAEELERQLTGRRYEQGKLKKIVVEKKEFYKARLGRSPDHADSFTIFVHLFRINGSRFVSMIDKPKEEKRPRRKVGYVDQVTFLPDTSI